MENGIENIGVIASYSARIAQNDHVGIHFLVHESVHSAEMTPFRESQSLTNHHIGDDG
jgi:hypothetical protein